MEDMKNWMVTAVAVILFIAACLFVFIGLAPKKAVIFEEIVPKSAIYYISTSNLNKAFQDFKSSQFFQKFSETSIYKNQLGPAWEKFSSKATFLRVFFDKDIAIAVLTLGQAQGLSPNRDFKVEGLGNFLTLVRIDVKQFPQIKRSLGETFIDKFKGRTISTSYLGVKITTYQG